MVVSKNSPWLCLSNAPGCVDGFLIPTGCVPLLPSPPPQLPSDAVSIPHGNRKVKETAGRKRGIKFEMSSLIFNWPEVEEANSVK